MVGQAYTARLSANRWFPSQVDFSREVTREKSTKNTNQLLAVVTPK